MKKLTQAEIWDEIARPWSELRDSPIPLVARFLEGKTGNILDLGCGSGRHFSLIEGNLFAVDFSEEMLKLAKKQADKLQKEATLIHSSASKIPFADNFFDAAIYIAALHCIEKPLEREKSLKELFRTLKPDSEALILVWSKNDARVKNKPKEAYIPWTINDKKYFRYYYIYDLDELRTLLEKVGFEILSLEENRNIVARVRKPSKSL